MTGQSQDQATYPPSAETAASAHINADAYDRMYAQSVSDPDSFWGEHGKQLDWIKPYTKVKQTSFAPGNVSIKWFDDGTLNVCANCVDRHLETRGDQTAIIFEPDNPAEPAQHITYKALHAEVCKMANILEGMGVRKGDRVVVRTRSGEVMAKILQRKSTKGLELKSLNPDHEDRHIANDEVEWIARIIWASQ